MGDARFDAAAALRAKVGIAAERREHLADGGGAEGLAVRGVELVRAGDPGRRDARGGLAAEGLVIVVADAGAQLEARAADRAGVAVLDEERPLVAFFI